MLLQRPIAMNKRYLTGAEFARQVGMSATAIYKAMDTGRIACVVRKGQRLIDWRTEGPRFVAESPEAAARVAINGQAGNGNGGPPELSAQQRSLAESRLAQEQYKAKKMEMEYLERIDKLIEVDWINNHLISIAVMLRKAVQGIPDRVTPLVAAETDPHVVHQLIENECHTILEDLASEIERREIIRDTDEYSDSDQTP